MATQLSHEFGETSTPLLEETIGDNLARTVAKFGDREALVDVLTGRRWTYTQFADAVDRLATGLVQSGVQVGDRVGIWAPSLPEWVLVQYATARIGAILVTINPAYRRDELQYVLNQSGIRTVIAARSFKKSDYEKMLHGVREDCPELHDVIIIGSPAWDTVAETEIDQQRLDEIAARLTPNDDINIQYTSGTTGRPKGATLSHRNLLNNGFFVGEGINYTEADRVCIPVPFYHCFAMVLGNLACTSHGAAMIIPAPGFDPAATLHAVEAESCTSLYGVPTMFIAELERDDFTDYDTSSLRTGIMAGSPCPETVMRQVMTQMNMHELSICYGMTETSPISLQTNVSDPMEQRVSTVGRVGPHLQIRVADPATGEALPRGEAGELQTFGYSVMKGYWNDPEKTAEAVDEQGWMRTGDLAVMDEAGYVTITGRIKDMIIRGGENIYPREVEELLYTHPDIIDAQIVGVPDEKFGEELMAWLRVREGAEAPTAESVYEFCYGKIAHYKIPRYVEVLEEFPMTVTGKVRKVELRDQAVSLLTGEPAL